MKLLDLFCGAGGAAMGYHRAGFDVVGVDIKPQPHYPFEFHQADAFEYLAEHSHEFDAIHASPPCQGYSRLRHLPWLKGREYPLLIDATREALQATGKLWVIENVADAPLNGALLCGAALGLNLVRHRRFESSILLLFPHCPGHPVLFRGSANMKKYGQGSGVTGLADGQNPALALGIDWMTGAEMRQAIPPAYTEFIGWQLLEAIRLTMASTRPPDSAVNASLEVKDGPAEH
jgi:DNA (cytosine-5)-methyltransferase 1